MKRVGSFHNNRNYYAGKNKRVVGKACKHKPKSQFFNGGKPFRVTVKNKN